MNSLPKCARVLAASAAAAAAAVIVSWIADIPALRSWAPGHVGMKMNTALCVELLAASLWVTAAPPADRTQRVLGRAFACAALGIAMATAVEFLFGVNLRIDQLLVHEALGDVATPFPGRISMLAVLLLSMLASALLIIDLPLRRCSHAAQALAAASLLTSVMALIGYSFEATSLYSAGSHTQISLPAALALSLLGVGILSARADRGWMQAVISAHAGGRMLRIALPTVLVSIWVLGWVSVQGVRLGWYSYEVDQAYLIAPLSVVFLALLFWAARRLDRSDGERERQAAELAELNRALESRVADRTHQLTQEIRERQRLNRTLTMINRCKCAVIEQRDEVSMLRALCQAIVDAGYAMAWVGYLEQDDHLTIRPVAQAGAAEDYLAKASISWRESDEHGRGPSGTAARNGQPEICRDIAAHPRMRPWREEAIRRGFRSCIALPLKSRGRVFGIASIYSAETDAFDSEETSLLAELAENVAFGIGVLRATAEQRRLAAIVECSEDAVLSKDLHGVIQTWNAGAEQLYGYTAQEAIGKPVTVLVPPERRDEVLEIFSRVAGGERVASHDTERLHKDGTRMPVSITVSPIRDGAGAIVGASSVARDIRERKRLEYELRHEQLYTRSLIEASIDALMTTDPSGIITDVNHQMEVLTGRDRKQLIGTAFKQYCTQPDRAQAGIEKVIAHGRVTDYELVVRHAAGGITPVAYNATTFYDPDQRLQGVFAAARDTTELKRIELALRQSEQRYRSLVLASAQIVWSTNAAGEVSGDMPMWRAFTGATVERLQGAGWLDSLHPDDRPRTIELWRRAVAARSLYEAEYRLRRKDGEYRIVAARGVPVLGPGGVVREWVGTCTDVTEQKRAEAELRRASLYARTLLEASLDPLVTIGKDGRIMDVNRATEQATGLDRERLVGSDFSEYFTQPEKAREGYQRVFEQGYVRDYPLILRNAGGHLTDVLYNATVFRNEAGEIEGVFAAARDITQRKRAEAALQQAHDELEDRVRERTAELAASNQELESFTYSVSHDLRAPLRHIDGFSRILDDQYGPHLDEQARHYLARIREGTLFMGRLVDDLLNLSRVGRRALNLQITSLETLVGEVRQDLAPEMEGRDIQWQVGALPFWECDPGLMKQVLANLISNALKFTRPRPKAVIEIGQTDEGGRNAVFIRDNGVGFSMKYADKLFGVFQRLHRQEDFEGTGIGLATVRRILRKHGGDIWAEAGLDKGATFYFNLGEAEQLRSKPGEHGRVAA